jgi:thermitase
VFNKRQFASGLSLLLGLGALVACGQVQRQVPQVIQKSESVLTVQLLPGQSKASIEKSYDGQVVVWNPEQGFAIVSTSRTKSSMATQSTQSSLEENQARFLASGMQTWMNGQSTLWAEGQSTLWAEGQSTLWAEGQSTLWAEGQFQIFPANSQVWTSIHLSEAHQRATSLGRNVKIAVLDTGIDLAHPMFKSSLVASSEMWDFVDQDLIPQEEGSLGVGGFGHGTAIAGIILQIAPAAKIMPLRVLGANGKGDVLHLAAAINFAVAKGAQIINLSLGSDEMSPAIEASLQAATDQGVLIVSSSGNDGQEKLSYPASFASLDNQKTGWQRLSVTSVSANLQKSTFANFGRGVEIAAPGELIASVAPNVSVATWTGTSMAVPVIAGGLALALGEKLTVPIKDLADELYQSVSGDLYNNSTNNQYKDLVGKGNLNLYTFLKNTTLTAN